MALRHPTDHSIDSTDIVAFNRASVLGAAIGDLNREAKAIAKAQRTPDLYELSLEVDTLVRDTKSLAIRVFRGKVQATETVDLCITQVMYVESRFAKLVSTLLRQKRNPDTADAIERIVCSNPQQAVLIAIRALKTI